MDDTLEIYRDGSYFPFVTLPSSFQPNDGDLINILGQTYIVLGRSFTVDHSEGIDKSIRCNVIVTESTGDRETPSHE